MSKIQGISDLVLAYPNYQLGQIIDPEQANLNNLQLVNKINLLAKELNKIAGNDASGSSSTFITIKSLDELPSLTTVEETLHGMWNLLKSANGGTIVNVANTSQLQVTLQEALVELKQIIDENKLSSDNSFTQINQYVQDILTELRSADANVNTRVNETNVNVTANAESIKINASNISNNANAISELQSYTIKINDDVQLNKQNIGELEKNLQTTNSNVTSNNKAIVQNTNDILTLKNVDIEIKGNIVELKEQLGVTNTNVSNNATNINTLQEEMMGARSSTLYDKTFKNVDARFEESEKKVLQNEANIQALINSKNEEEVVINMSNFQTMQYTATGNENNLIPLPAGVVTTNTVFYVYMDGAKLIYNREFYVDNNGIHLNFDLVKGDVVDIEYFHAVADQNEKLLRSSSISVASSGNRIETANAIDGHVVAFNLEGKTTRCVFADRDYQWKDMGESDWCIRSVPISACYVIQPSHTYLLQVEVLENTVTNGYCLSKTPTTSTACNEQIILPQNQTGVFNYLITTKADISNCTELFQSSKISKTDTGKIFYRRTVYDLDDLYAINTSNKYPVDLTKAIVKDDDYITFEVSEDALYDTKSLVIPSGVLVEDTAYVMFIDIVENTSNSNFTLIEGSSEKYFKDCSKVIAPGVTGVFVEGVFTQTSFDGVTDTSISSQFTSLTNEGKIVAKRALFKASDIVRDSYKGFVNIPTQFKSNKKTIDFGYTLRSVQTTTSDGTKDDVVKDEFLLDVDGVGTLIQRIKEVFVKDYVELFENATFAGDQECLCISFPLQDAHNTEFHENECYCDKVANRLAEHVNGERYVALVGQKVYFSIPRSELGIEDTYDYTSDNAETLITAFKTWASTYNPKLIYVLDTPITTYIQSCDMNQIPLEYEHNTITLETKLNTKFNMKIPCDVGTYVKSLETRIADLEAFIQALAFQHKSK